MSMRHAGARRRPVGRGAGGRASEISRYGTLKAWATKLGMPNAVELLDQTLNEEKKTDDALSKIAVSTINAEAA